MPTYTYRPDRPVTLYETRISGVVRTEVTSVPDPDLFRVTLTLTSPSWPYYQYSHVIQGPGSWPYQVSSLMVTVEALYNVDHSPGDLDMRFTHTASNGQVTTSAVSGPVTILANPNLPADLIGTSGSDALAAGDGQRAIAGRAGDDTLTAAGSEAKVLRGHAGNDLLDARLLSATASLQGGADIDTLYGGSAGDTLDGGWQGDSLNGGAGHDRLAGQEGNDTQDGGDGNDTLEGGTEDDELAGGNGNDALDGAEGNDLLRGGAGNDWLYGGWGADTLDGGSGDDYYYLYILEEADVILDTEGEDTISVRAESYVLPDGIETLVLDGAGPAAGTGNAGHNRITGTSGADTLSGGAGNDTLHGVGGSLWSGWANDDQLSGGAGADVFFFDLNDAGYDTILDFDSQDRVDVGALGFADYASLRPFLHGRPDLPEPYAWISVNVNGRTTSQQVLFPGIDPANLGPEAFIFSTAATDRLITGESDLLGGAGNDTLEGSGSYDSWSNMLAVAGPGRDLLIQREGAYSSHRMWGGTNNDVFRLTSARFGEDVVEDWNAGDRIDLSAFNLFEFTSVQPLIVDGPDGAVLWLSGAGSLTLTGVQRSDLGADAFIFNPRPVTTGQLLAGTASSEGLFGGRGNDTVEGREGRDAISGGSGDDRIDGGLGNDTLGGGAGNDRFVVGPAGFGNDLIGDFGPGDRIDLSARGIGSLAALRPFMRTVGADTVIDLHWNGPESITLANVDSLALAAASFIFRTGAGPLDLVGTTGADALFGSAGNDRFEGRGGADSIVGDGGDDLFVFAFRPIGNTVILDFSEGDRLDLSRLNVGDFQTLAPFVRETAGSVEIALGSAGRPESIVLQGFAPVGFDAADVVFRTGTTPIQVTAVAGNGVLFGGNGADALNGSAGSDAISAGAGNDTVTGAAGNDTLRGGAGDDRLTGGADADRHTYDHRGFGNDTVVGFAAEDRIVLAPLNVDSFDTLLALATAAGGDTLLTFGFGGQAESIRIAGVPLESLTGGMFTFGTTSVAVVQDGGELRDALFGGSAGDSLRGKQGDDRLFGAGGSDTLAGGHGSDTLWGGNGDDVLNGGEGTDTILGGDGNDTLTGARMEGGAGNDTYVLTLDTDTIVDTAGRELVRTSLASYTLQDGLENLSGTASGQVQVLAGNAADNQLNAGSAGALLSGLAGNDRLTGGSGADTLVGGIGADVLAGGTGSDLFRYAGVRHSTHDERDQIRDFDAAQGDRIDLMALDARPGGADDAFTFIGASAFSGAGGELAWRLAGSKTLVLADLDGDRLAEFEIQLSGAQALTAAAFQL